MTESDVARWLLEAGDTKVDPKLKVLLNRMMLQVASTPSLQSYLVDAGIVPCADGTALLQFDFLRLPEEVLPQVEMMFAVEHFRSHDWYQFVRNGQAHTAFQLKISAEDLPGRAYDYAY
jgi:hypothetical protein